MAVSASAAAASLVRRSTLVFAAALATRLATPPPRSAAAKIGDIEAKAEYHATKSGLLYFDKKIFLGASGFDDVPCRGECLERTWGVDADAVDLSPAPLLNEVGKQVKIEYRVRRGGFTAEIVALSDGIGNGGSIIFNVGDGTVNAAVDELVRSLPPNIVRRAIVPAAFDLDAGTRPEYPRPQPPGTTYLELALRKPSASGDAGVCPGGDERYNKVATCVCGSGPAKDVSV